MAEITIGGRQVGDNHRVFLIGEIGINHNGDVDIAKQLIDAAVKAEFDAVKFQKRNVEKCYPRDVLNTPRASPWGTTTREQKLGLEFSYDEYLEIDDHCKKNNIMWFASPWDEDSVEFLERFNVPCHKIASARARNSERLWHCLRATGRPLIFSTGACDQDHVDYAVRELGEGNLILMHCVLEYPFADPRKANLRTIQTLKNRYDTPVGYSGHEDPSLLDVSLCAVARGAASLERHITLNRDMYGSDQKASITPDEMVVLAQRVRSFEEILGDGVKRVLPGEAANFEKLQAPKAVVCAK